MTNESKSIYSMMNQLGVRHQVMRDEDSDLSVDDYDTMLDQMSDTELLSLYNGVFGTRYTMSQLTTDTP